MQLYLNYGNEILIFVIFAGSLNLLSGYAGMFSVAHAAFAAAGGYAVAYLWVNHHTPLLLALAIAVALAALLGALVALPAVRLAAEWLMLLTLAFHVLTLSLVGAVPELGGAYGLQGIAGLDIFGYELEQPGDIFAVCLGAAIVVLAVCFRLGESPYGRVLRAIREDEIAAASLGKPTANVKLAVFVITSVMAALAGALLVVQNSVASPGTYQFGLVTTIVAIVIVGGSGNLVGSILGAIVVVLLDPLLERFLLLDPQRAAIWREIAFGSLLVVIMFVRPRGLLPELTNSLGRALSTSAATEEQPRRRTSDEAPIGVAPNEGTAVRAPRAASAPSGTMLEVSGLSKRFGGVVAADSLDFALEPGSITAFVGPNGAGKTTLFNLLTGLVRPDSGSVLFGGREITGLRPDQVARLGVVRSFQDVRVFPRLSALRNVALAIPGQPGERIPQLFLRPGAARRSERTTLERAAEWLRFVGLEEAGHAPAGSLGLGEQKLLGLARALATEARVLLLDEPAAGMDVQWVEKTLALVARVRETDRTVCIVEHNLNVVGRLADHVFFIELGRITAQGTLQSLTKDRRLADAYFGTR